ncbi:hypothetical protein AVEN_152892-1 [Araneus ventricosus]|uniref:Uncharacterized protein n=1 Tax=Araneus ventricosus TaxID=182803 RepID=A0A4Y2ACW3_ARAVE|nr:hypothetical protein AVEN_152892-1 [Araneus ventricosus]
MASEGASHEKLLPLCLLLASHGQPKAPHVCVRGDPLDGCCTVIPGVCSVPPNYRRLLKMVISVSLSKNTCQILFDVTNASVLDILKLLSARHLLAPCVQQSVMMALSVL